MGKIRVHTHSELDTELTQHWQKLWEKVSKAHLFNSPQWFLACKEAYGFRDVRIVSSWEGKELVGILPLVKTRKFGLSMHCYPGEDQLSKSSLLLMEADEQIIASMRSALMELGAFHLGEMDKKVSFKLMEGEKALKRTPASVSPFLPIGENPLMFVSKKTKSKIRNKAKKLSSHLLFTRYRGASQKHMNILRDIEQKSFKGMRLGKKDNTWRLLEALSAYAPENVSIDVLYYDEKPIVYSVGFLWKGIYHAYKTAYDVQFRKLAPGKLLLLFLTEELVKNGITRLDFSRGESPLKREFTPYKLSQYEVSYTPNALKRIWWSLASFIEKQALTRREIVNLSYRVKKRLFYLNHNLKGAYGR